MAVRKHAALRRAVVDAARSLVDSGVMSLTRHGSFSVRVPGTETLLLTASGSFEGLQPQMLALLDMEGNLLEGEMDPTNAEIVGLHTVVYKHRPEAASAVHTHSPHATTFAVAGRPLECCYESMVRLGMTEPVPLAHYGPRGSAMAIANIAAALASAGHTRAVLLESHGILAFGPDPAGAARAVLVIEEAARLALQAEVLGGAKVIPPELRKATLERLHAFQRAGVRRA